jgi:hypothetical protein
MDSSATEESFILKAQILYSRVKSLMVKSYLYVRIWNVVADFLLLAGYGLKESKETSIFNNVATINFWQNSGINIAKIGHRGKGSDYTWVLVSP